MTEYYCHTCAIRLKLVSPAEPTTFSGNDYQLSKFMKHTMPSGWVGVNSVFTDPSYETYANYLVSTTHSGCLEIDDRGRKNMIWYAGSGTGLTYENGLFKFSGDGVKVVCAEDEHKIHGFPFDSAMIRPKFCHSCGKPVIK